MPDLVKYLILVNFEVYTFLDSWGHVLSEKKVEKNHYLATLICWRHDRKSWIFWIFYAIKYCKFNFCRILKILVSKYSEEQTQIEKNKNKIVEKYFDLFLGQFWGQKWPKNPKFISFCFFFHPKTYALFFLWIFSKNIRFA